MKKTLIFDNGAHTLKVGQGKQEVKLVCYIDYFNIENLLFFS